MDECPTGAFRLETGDDGFKVGVVTELIFEITQEADGGYCAECLTENIFTQGDTWKKLRANVKEAVAAFYFDRPGPDRVRLHLVRDEMLAVR